MVRVSVSAVYRYLWVKFVEKTMPHQFHTNQFEIHTSFPTNNGGINVESNSNPNPYQIPNLTLILTRYSSPVVRIRVRIMVRIDLL